MRPRAIVFDVNETLLDLHGLDPFFTATFGDVQTRADWFKQLLALALASNSMGEYVDFSTMGRRALQMIGEQRGRAIGDGEVRALTDAIKGVRAHPDVEPALRRLRDAGIPFATLTNSPPATVTAQMEQNGLAPLFDKLLSVDAVQRYKPAREVYAYGAREMGVDLPDLMLVAAHGWDVFGAMHAGARAVFVKRPGQVLVPDAPPPEIIGESLAEVVDAILAE